MQSITASQHKRGMSDDWNQQSLKQSSDSTVVVVSQGNQRGNLQQHFRMARYRQAGNQVVRPLSYQFTLFRMTTIKV